MFKQAGGKLLGVVMAICAGLTPVILGATAGIVLESFPLAAVVAIGLYSLTFLLFGVQFGLFDNDSQDSGR